MEFKTIKKISIIHLTVLAIALFLCFNYKEHEDMDVIVFGTFIYVPYLIGLTFLNSTFLAFGLNYFKSNLFKWLGALSTSFVLIVWYIIKAGQIELYFWKVNQNEFFILNLILLFLNLITMYFVTKKNRNTQTN